jgi:hypothetical protein
MTNRTRAGIAGAILLLIGASVSVVAVERGMVFTDPEPSPPVIELPAPPAEATSAQVHEMCGACHAYPPADSFPRAAWRKEVKQGYDFFRTSNLQIQFPSLESVVRYYENRAPEVLPEVPRLDSADPSPVRWRQHSYRLPAELGLPAVSNVNLVHLSDPTKLDVLVCDMRNGYVLTLRPDQAETPWKVLGRLRNPAHAEVVDLDGDGIPDLVVADLGTRHLGDDKVGRVVWLHGQADGSFTPVTLLEGVGRVADVQAADFNDDGKLDLIVAVFGWRNTGEIIYLENRTTDWSHPVFVPHVVDERHGTIHVPVCDLNNDGRPDFVALISQEHETVVAFLNEGNGVFHKETIYTAPHPAIGSSGIQIVDLNGDGKLDVLYTNGDSMDPPPLLKPYHGVQWLENQGRFPFVSHPVTPLYGVMRAVAADLTGKGRKDILAVSFLPDELNGPGRASIIQLEPTATGDFVRYSLESGSCDYMSCVAGDVYGNGRAHLVTGHFRVTEARPEAITIWENLGVAGPEQK